MMVSFGLEITSDRLCFYSSARAFAAVVVAAAVLTAVLVVTARAWLAAGDYY